MKKERIMFVKKEELKALELLCDQNKTCNICGHKTMYPDTPIVGGLITVN